MEVPTVHRFQATLFPVNAYLLELADGIVVIDGTLGMSDGRALRARVKALAKPLLAVIVTHTHPDHYGALTALVEGAEATRIYATQGVLDVIRRDDPAKEQILRPMFGDEWARRRTFPNRTIQDGERVTFGNTALRVVDLGPGESPHDSLWLLESRGQPQAFVGDLAYNRMHGYFADGFHEAWLANLRRARRDLRPDTILYLGHGEPAPAKDLLEWQEHYILTFLDAVRAAAADSTLDDEAATASVTARMKTYLPSDDLLFLMQLSVKPLLDSFRTGAGASH